MTPAEELTKAADKLDELARAATPDFNSLDESADLFPEDRAYIDAMNPLVGKELSAFLRGTAEDMEGSVGSALRLARLINQS